MKRQTNDHLLNLYSHLVPDELYSVWLQSFLSDQFLQFPQGLGNNNKISVTLLFFKNMVPVQVSGYTGTGNANVNEGKLKNMYGTGTEENFSGYTGTGNVNVNDIKLKNMVPVQRKIFQVIPVLEMLMLMTGNLKIGTKKTKSYALNEVCYNFSHRHNVRPPVPIHLQTKAKNIGTGTVSMQRSIQMNGTGSCFYSSLIIPGVSNYR